MMRAAGRGVPLLGLGGVVLLLVGNEVGKVGGGSPDLHAAPDAYLDAVGGYDTGVAGVYLVLLGWFALAAFFSSFAEQLRGTPEGNRGARLIVGGVILATALMLAGALPLLTAAVMVADGDLGAQTAKALLLANGGVFVLLWLVVAVPLGTAAVVGMRRGVVGRALGRSGAALAGLLVVASPAVWWIEGPAIITWMPALLWIATVSVSLSRRPPVLRRGEDPSESERVGAVRPHPEDRRGAAPVVPAGSAGIPAPGQ